MKGFVQKCVQVAEGGLTLSNAYGLQTVGTEAVQLANVRLAYAKPQTPKVVLREEPQRPVLPAELYPHRFSSGRAHPT